MTVRKAVIPAAGLGTRFLPASRAVPKNLIPVVDRPMIQYAVEELARAGISEVCIVISRGTEAVVEHFKPDEFLESALKEGGKNDLLDELRRIQDLADVTYVYQEEPLGLGHAVGCAREFVGDEPFVGLLPDELFDPRGNFAGEMVEVFQKEGRSVVAVYEVTLEEISRYGAIDSEDFSSSPIEVRSVVEKPARDQAPSSLALVGRYVLVPEIFETIEGLEPGAGGEIQLTDGLGVLAERGELLALKYEGRKWDVGNKQGYLEAVVTLGAEHEELGERFRRFLDAFRA